MLAESSKNSSSPSEKAKIKATQDVVPLRNTNPSQLAAILKRLQLTAPDSMDQEDRINILRCSCIFQRHFADYEFDDIFAIFRKSTLFVDFCTADGEITGIFGDDNISGKKYPCSECGDEVTDNEDDTGYGHRCSACDCFFHNLCLDNPVSNALYDLLHDSPNYIRIYCPQCFKGLSSIESKISAMDDRLSKIEDLITKNNTNPVPAPDGISGVKSYKDAVSKMTEMTAASKNLVRELSTHTKPATQARKAELDKRTRIVRKPEGKDIRNSKDIRKALGKKYPGIVIQQARTTAGGSIFLELQKEEDAIALDNNWDPGLFSGNSGLVKPGSGNTSVIVRHVYLDNSVDEIKDLVSKTRGVSNYDLFMRDGEFTGTMKITFETEEQYKTVVECKKVTMFGHSFLAEPFVSKPRVIKCHRCQKIGHIASLCRSKDPVCGRCGSTDHETKDCKSATVQCVHCESKDHPTGAMVCKVMKDKLEEISARSRHYG